MHRLQCFLGDDVSRRQFVLRLLGKPPDVAPEEHRRHDHYWESRQHEHRQFPGSDGNERHAHDQRGDLPEKLGDGK